jgi:type I restriction-modification system DNA methylase subunit
MSDETSFRKQLATLVRQFQAGEDHFLSQDYPESQVRIDFIDKFFEALGWSIRLQPGHDPRDRDVIVERAETHGRPDYNFRIDRRTKFFVEAKAPCIPIARSDIVLQAKKYAWNNTDEFVYFAAVTDFQEFRLYDASRKPDPRHPEAGLVFAYAYEQYLSPKALADLWQLSRPAVAAGSLDALISPSARAARAKTPLDIQFLSDLSHWRELLAKSVFKAHPDLTAQDLNNAVQVFLDRLIFIRIAEDRGALPPNRLREIARSWKDQGKERPLTADLLPLFAEVNEDLNGEIFKPHSCERIKWDSAIVADIIENGLEPYNFAQIGVELLGSIYERYLGKTIRVTHTRAIVEDKPEVRKAGGVYYTPKYVVDYMVQQALEPLLHDKTPRQVARLKIVDPACGSGSFLLAAYEYLLKYHLRWYAEHPRHTPNDGQPRLFLDPETEEPRLSILEKARILRNNIFGVDLDLQAVEITMMSLYIKLLEGEKGLPHKRGLLPSLAANIKWGNSLVASYIISQSRSQATSPALAFFDWDSDRTGFGSVMDSGGFDLVIGNPPYVQLSMMDYFNADINSYVSSHYSSSMARLNTFGFFIERALRTILRENGYLSYIVPNTLLSQEYYRDLRRQMLQFDLRNITTYSYPVFADAVVETVVFLLRKTATKGNKLSVTTCDNHLMTYSRREVPQDTYLTTHNNAFLLNVDPSVLQLRAKLESERPRLQDLVHINQAIALKHDRSKSLHRRKKAANFKPVLDGRNIHRYRLEWAGWYLEYNRDAIHSCKRTDLFEASEKLFFRRVGDRLIATYDDRQYYALNTLVVISPKALGNMSIKYVLALINSTLLNYFYITYLKSSKKVFSEIQARQLGQIPIHPIDFSDDKQRRIHDDLVHLVDDILALNAKALVAEDELSGRRLEQLIDATDEKIDSLVCQLYRLTQQDIRLLASK